MKKTLITLAAISASSAVNAQSLDRAFFESQGINTNFQSINGTYDVSNHFGVAGLSVTITGDAFYDATYGANIFLGAEGTSVTYAFNQDLNVTLQHGGTLSGLEKVSFTGGSLSLLNTDVDNAIVTTGSNYFENTTTSQYSNPSNFSASSTGSTFTLTADSVAARNYVNLTYVGTVVPEPSSALLLGLGSLGLLARRKRS